MEIGAYVTPYAASTNGSVVAGYDSTSYFIYTDEGGYQSIGGLPPGNNVGGKPTLSGDGMRVSGTSQNSVTNFSEMSYYERATATWVICGNLGSSSGTSTSSGWGMSQDGSTVVGLGWISAGSAHGCYWREGVGMLRQSFSAQRNDPPRITRCDAPGWSGLAARSGPVGFSQTPSFADCSTA